MIKQNLTIQNKIKFKSKYRKRNSKINKRNNSNKNKNITQDRNYIFLKYSDKYYKKVMFRKIYIMNSEFEYCLEDYNYLNNSNNIHCYNNSNNLNKNENNYIKNLIYNSFDNENINKLENKARRNHYDNLDNYINDLVWCNHCQQWETKEYHDEPNHWMYYKNKTKIFIEENKELFYNFIKNIVGFDNLKDAKAVCGIYRWYVDDIPYYVGQSKDVLSRSCDHIREMLIFPEYWVEIKNEIQNGHKLKIEFEEYKLKELDKKELEWIDKLKPISQKCDGTDCIIPLEERNYDITNLKEMYKYRIG